MCRNLRYSGVRRAGTGQPKGEKERDMRCGKGHEHATVEQVKACYGVQGNVQPKVRTNKYAGTCIRCSGTVAPNTGILSRSPGVGSQRLGQGDWIVQHVNNDDCEEARLLQGIKDMQPKQADKPRQSANFKSIPQGYYATRKEHGIDFWFVRVPETGKWDGYRFVRRIVGGSGSPISIHGSESVAALHAILEAGVEAAGNLFADELEECKHCRKPLTRKASREMRKGSTCADNRGQGDEWKRLDALYDHQ